MKIGQSESQKEENNKTTALKQQDGQMQVQRVATSEIQIVQPQALEKQISKSVPAGIEEDGSQKLSEHDAVSTRKERPVLFTELQLDQKEHLYPVPVSYLQEEKKIGETSSAEREYIIRQDSAETTTADIARKFEKAMGEKSTSQLQAHVINHIPLNDSDQPLQTKLEINQQDELPVEMSTSRKNSAESVYTVQPGDTLASISLKIYGTSSKWSSIVNANKDQLANNPDGLQVGTSLAIPLLSKTGNGLLSPGSSTSLPNLNEDGTYTVQSGDSLSLIAQKMFGNAWKWQKIYELNNDVLTAPHKLKVGQVLKVKETIESVEPKLEKESPADLNLGEGPSENIDSQ